MAESMNPNKITIGSRNREDLGDIKALAASIEKYGLIHPIVINSDGSLVAGRRRLGACKLLGWTEVPIRILDTDAETPENTDRKDYTPEETVVAGRKREAAEVKAAKDAQLAGLKQYQDRSENFSEREKGEAKVKVAKAVGMSKPTYEKAKEIVEAAEKDPKTFRSLVDMMNKTGKVDRAYKELQKEKRSTQRKESVANAPPAESYRGEYELNHVYVADIRSLKLPEGSIDLVFTDPPYHDEHLDLFGELAKLSAHVLKPGGLCISYVGKMFLPQILGAMDKCLEYVWTLAITQEGNQSRVWKHHIFENWRPVVIYRKAGDSPVREWIQDIGRGARDKAFHDWQQDVETPRKCIAAYTLPGDVILDPFVGGGTTPYVCQELGRRFLCFDIDEDAIRLTMKRLKQNGKTSIQEP